jgi:hypothetical protein
MKEINENSYKYKSYILNKNSLNVVVLETYNTENKMYPRLHLSYYIDMYRNNKWTVIRGHDGTRYRVIKELENYYVYVRLRDCNNRKITVGVFETMLEADDFISVAYPNKNIYGLALANNALTKEYVLKNKIKRPF